VEYRVSKASSSQPASGLVRSRLIATESAARRCSILSQLVVSRDVHIGSVIIQGKGAVVLPGFGLPLRCQVVTERLLESRGFLAAAREALPNIAF
jgi:hypothetical protein